MSCDYPFTRINSLEEVIEIYETTLREVVKNPHFLLRATLESWRVVHTIDNTFRTLQCICSAYFHVPDQNLGNEIVCSAQEYVH